MEKTEGAFDAVLSYTSNQELLFLKQDRIMNAQGQELGYFNGPILYNLMDQPIARIEQTQIMNHQNQLLGEIAGDRIVNITGEPLPLLATGTTEQHRVKVAAFFFFL